MRCATVRTVYAFTGTGTTRGTFTGLSVGNEGATCTAGQYVVLTPAELDQYTTSPFQMDLVEAGAISSAILAVWALGFGVRMIVRAMRADETKGEFE